MSRQTANTTRRAQLAKAVVLVAAISPVAALLSGAGSPAWASTRAATKTATSARAKVIANWEAFFSGRTPAARKIQLVQDGPQFAPVIRAQAGSPMAMSTTAKVTEVKLAPSGKTALVVYKVSLGGKPVPSPFKGEAVLLGGTWKVGAASFCSLLALEGTHPAVCKALVK